MRIETDSAPPLGQVILGSITGSDKRVANSSLDPYSQPNHLKHTRTENEREIL